MVELNFAQIENLLSIINDPVARLEVVMDIGKNLLPPPENAICSDISGCASFVQICHVGNHFYGRADSGIIRGILAILISMVDGKTVDEIRNMPLDKMFADLNINIGAARLNGVNSMIRFFKNL